MKQPQSISFVGAGALAGGLARLLRARGYRIAEIVARAERGSRRRAAALAREVEAVATTLVKAKLDCDALWLAVPDAAIEQVAQEVAQALEQRAHLVPVVGGEARQVRVQASRRGQPGRRGPRVVLHASGALGSEALMALAARGIETGSAHPMMTFVAGEPPDLEGAWFAVEGTPAAVRAARAMAKALGANSFRIERGSKTLYHAFGAMLSPMLATELEAAERVGRRAGIEARQVRRIMEPIVLRTVQNVLRSGAGKSFSGPLARGDVRTVAAHLEALRGEPEAKVYRALVSYAIEMLPVKRREEMKKLLEVKKPSRRGGAVKKIEGGY
jgi:predicted short-subunit dehydrogenase-like oxidoreductase (DUF2520 family)